jgi:hypothetical protein
VASGTGLTMRLECRGQIETMTTGKNADAWLTVFPFIPAFRHLLIAAGVSWFFSLLVCSARKPSMVAELRIDPGPALQYTRQRTTS